MTHHIPTYEIPQPSWAQAVDFQIYPFKSQAALEEGLSAMPIKTDIPHRHNFFEIFVFFQGKGMHMIDFQTYPVASPSIHFISPGQVHLLSSQLPFHGYVLAFSQQLWDHKRSGDRALSHLPFFSPFCQQPFIDLTAENQAYIERVLQNIRIDQQQAHPSSREITRSYLKALLLYCERLYEQQSPDSGRDEDRSVALAAHYQSLIEQHFILQHQVKFYADALHISPDHLNRVCKQVLGQKAGELLLNRILLEAKRLLLYSAMTQKEIAYHLHFKDPSYFCRIFKRKNGCSPLSFRQQMQEKYHR